jgi:hypothetical protein
MKTLIMMYVYFDADGNIKAISPDTDAVSASLYSLAMFPLTDVESFLTAKKNTFDFYVKSIETFNKVEYKILRKKQIEISKIRAVDTYLTEITSNRLQKDTIILIENFISLKQLKITITPELRTLKEEGSVEAQESIVNFINTPTATLFFTKKQDPYFLIHSFLFSPKALFDEGTLIIDYEKDLKNLSVFTRRIINRYTYIERE